MNKSKGSDRTFTPVTLEELQELRAKSYKLMPLSIIFMMSPLIVNLILFFFFEFIINTVFNMYFYADEIYIVATLITLVFCFASFPMRKYASKNINKLEAMVGDLIVRDLLDEFFNVYEYDYYKGISEADIRRSDIDRFTVFNSKSYVSGRYKDVTFRFSDVRTATESTGGEGGTIEHVSFFGQWFIFDMYEDFGQKLIVSPAPKKLFGEREVGGDVVQVFNSRYNIASTDNAFTYKIITPKLMQDVMRVHDKLDCKLYFAIEGSRLHIAIQTGGPLFISNTNNTDLNSLKDTFRRDLRSILEFADQFITNEILFDGLNDRYDSGQNI